MSKPLLITMQTLHRAHKPKGIVLRIPGGWRVRVARIVAEPWQEAQYAAYLARTGMDAGVARALARRCVQQSYVHGYVDGLREAVWRRACEYADMWPMHVRDTGERKRGVPIVLLHGFAPERIADCYIPITNLGKRASTQARQLLADMGRAALDEHTRLYGTGSDAAAR